MKIEVRDDVKEYYMVVVGFDDGSQMQDMIIK